MGNAGANQTVELAQLVSLNGAVNDDGLHMPPGLFTNGWRQVSGPGAASFENPTAAQAKAAFTQPGVYTLRLTDGDGIFPPSSDVPATVMNGFTS